MARMSLSLETLKDWDFGKAAVAWQAELKRVVTDMLDRPGDQRARTLTLECSLSPILQQEGDVIDAAVSFLIKSKIPPRQTCERPALISKNGQLFFSEHAPDNPRQHTLDEAE